jgi:hypothetical protein
MYFPLVRSVILVRVDFQEKLLSSKEAKDIFECCERIIRDGLS